VSAPGARRPSAPRGSGWLVGIVAFVALAYILLNTLRSEGVGSAGPRVGSALPPFAAPLATSSLQGDVNVARRADQGSAGRRPACEVRGPDVVNSCQLAARGPVAVAFFFTRGASCLPALDALNRALRAHPRVQGVAVSVRVDRGEVRRLVRAHRWSFPVAYDHDGVLANVYGVAGCPHVTLAGADGRVRETLLGREATTQLDRALASLERGA
jgi:peroxiredoxin